MTLSSQIYDFLDTLAPQELAMDWDNCGLQIGSRNLAVSKVLVALDPFEDVCREAIAVGAELVVTHHPLFFDPIRAVTDETAVGRAAALLIRGGISLYSCHMDLDIAPGGVAVIVETMTDNRNRTAGSVRHHFDKYGGNLGANGCVSWSFDKKGVLVIDNEDGDYEEDQVMMDAMDCGADDFEADDDVFTVYTTPDDFNAVADALTAKKYSFVSAQIEMVPQNYVKLSPEDAEKMEKMLELFDDDDDVQNTWHNWDQD